MSKTRIVLAGLALIVATSLVACSDGESGPGGPNTLFRGTWLSDEDVGLRGSLRLDGTRSYGNVDGTLTLDAGMPSERVVHVSGTETYDWGGDYTVYELSGEDVSLDGVLYGSLNDTVMVGSHVGIGGSYGSWHTVVSDDVVEAAVEKAFAIPTGWSVTDLCFASGTLYATATPQGSITRALYEVNQDTGAFSAVAGAPSDPAGVASDGSQFFVSSGGGIEVYDSSWSNTGTLVPDLLNTPSQLAYQGGAVWYLDSTVPFFQSVKKVDVVTKEVTSTSISPQRPEGIVLVGDQLWIGYYPAGGEWAQVVRYDTSTGARLKAFFAPNHSFDLMNGAGPLAAQGTSLWMVSGPGLYELAVP